MANSETRPAGRIWPWFIAFLVAMLAMGVVIDMADIQNRLHATALMLVPILLLVPMVRNAMARAASRGEAGNAQRAYLARMAVVSLAYLGSLFLAEHIIEDGDAMTPLTLALALVPGIAVAGYFWAIGRYLVELKDEFLKMLMVRQTLIATAIAFSLASIYGFLENFEFVPHLDAYWWPISFFFGLGVGAIANYFRYGTTGDCA
ncbi:hypothetical protein [Sphingomicrobium lutaoense]|uniref:FtsH-binding integral membrane protein n=1 Tax=Sphingomicrobium lutaoense TaxID=515949 RepID=A0A839YWQ8_9SPHN|nr:hypothetical protein [Sphingomicrobium lutaoense]MBB3764641.1 FtsH-binding integral membrane protein [Sphingomicrobium lutaoense]